MNGLADGSQPGPNQVTRKSMAVDTVDKWALIQKAKTVLLMERDVQNARGSTTFQQCVELTTTWKPNSTHLNGGNQRIPNRSAMSKEPLKICQTARQALTMSFFCQAVRHLKQVKKIKSDVNDRTLTVKIEDVIVKVEPDSGAAE